MSKKKSRAYAFRLITTDEHEIRAIKIIERWRSEGHDLRYIMTSALLRLDGMMPPEPRGIEGIENAISKLDEIVHELEQLGSVTAPAEVGRIQGEVRGLSTGLRGAMRQSVNFGEDDD